MEELNEGESESSSITLDRIEYVLSENSTFKPDVLSYEDSFGYDCKRRFNLCLIDDDMLVFASGNFLHFFSISKKVVMETLRTFGGGGIGFITKNPNDNYKGHLTVAENSNYPLIFIYQYPDMDIISVCKRGAKRSYSCIDYSIDGEMMVSQAGHPDYMITLWFWKEERIYLRCQSFQNDVYNVKFSQYDLQLLATTGIGHIKFWKIANTFTGIKLMGEHGRFGKTEISDITGVYQLPDEQVLSSCEWGNILVWEAGLIKLEVCQKNRQPCHKRPITQILPYGPIENNQIMTLGRDGYVRIWNWETVDLANPPEDYRFVDINPNYEHRIGSKNHLCELISMVKKNDVSCWWYAQDGNGGLWACDISPVNYPQPSEMLFRCHAGSIVSVQMCSFATLFATLGEDGRLHMYNYKTVELLYFQQFPAKGRDMIWLPVSVDPSGLLIVLGFDDGVIRIVVPLNLKRKSISEKNFKLIQVLKSHSKAITKLSINPRQTILVSGSEDNTIFVHQIERKSPHIVLLPIGLVQTPSPVTAINWKPNMFTTILLGCLHGHILQCDLPDCPRSYTEISYNLTHIEPLQQVFKSVKSEIRRELYILEIEKKKEEKRERKMNNLIELKAANPGIEIDEDKFLEDSEDEEELEPIYIPKIPNPVLWLMFTADNTIWLSMGGYDAGYIYEYDFESIDPIRSTIIEDGDDIEIHTYRYLENMLIFGMGDGAIRLNSVKEDFRDLSDYWLVNMHDNLSGIITSIDLSYDRQYLVSVGSDGNIFTYKWNIVIDEPPITMGTQLDEDLQEVEDILDRSHLSLEQRKQKDNDDKNMAIANERKNKVLAIITGYRKEFSKIYDRNEAIIESQRLHHFDFELDDRITDDFQNQMEEKMSLVKRKMAFDVERSKLLLHKVREYFIEPLEDWPIEILGIGPSTKSINSFRIKKLDDEYFSLKVDLEERIRLDLERRRVARTGDEAKVSIRKLDLPRLGSFMEILLASPKAKFSSEVQMERLLKRYRNRKANEAERKQTWYEMQVLMPDLNINHPDDEKALKDAEATIGDYKLKIDAEYIPDQEEDTTLNKFKELLRVREEIYDIRNNFNRKVFGMREMKSHLVKYIGDQLERLYQLHKELPKEHHIHPTLIPTINKTIEYPEKVFERTTRFNSASPYNKQHRFKSVISMETAESEDRLSKILANILKIYDNSDNAEATLSPWERELRSLRLSENLFEQSQIITDIKEKIENFDTELDALRGSKMNIEVNAKFLDLYLLTLNQELWILKDFERLKDNLINKVDSKVTEFNEIKDGIRQLNNQIELSQIAIGEFEEQIKVIQQEFVRIMSQYKFWDFLRRIFRKKYKPIKRRDSNISESSSEESSSESSSEEDGEAMSLDSQDVGPIRLDENKCPPGCDIKMYELTFTMRNKRHDMELVIRTEQQSIESNRNKISALDKDTRKVQIELEREQAVLTAFVREKQKNLNEVDTLVVLRLNQMQYFHNDEELQDIPKTVLFQRENVQKLYERIGQLAVEAIEAQRKHRINVIHLARMKTDCIFMEKQIEDLKEERQIAMTKKFGMNIDLDDMEESILRKFAYNIQSNVDEVKREYERKTNELKKFYAEKQTELTNEMQIGIEKLNILTVLKEEHNHLLDLKVRQERNQSKNESKNDNFDRDLIKLHSIAAKQEKQIITLEKEIRTLQLKAKPFKSVNLQEFHTPLLEYRTYCGEPDFDIKMFEGSVYNTCGNSPQSTINSVDPLASPRNLRQRLTGKIIQMIEDFLNMQPYKGYPELPKFPDNIDFHEIAKELATYFNEVVDHFDVTKVHEIIRNVVIKFQSTIPPSLIGNYRPKNIANLFHDALNLVLGGTALNGEFDVNELLTGIVEMVKDSIKNKVECDTTNFLLDVFREISNALPAENAIQSESIEKLLELLKQNPFEYNFKTVNTIYIKSSLTKYCCCTMSNDDWNVVHVDSFVDEVVKGLLEM